MVFVEPSFPRGPNVNIKPRANVRRRSRFGATIDEHAKPARLRPKDRLRIVLNEKNEEEEEHELSLKAHNLDYGTIQEGMLVLGCVQRILKMELHISLPGRLVGIVPISSISDVYSNLLQDMIRTNVCELPTLADLYRVGDLVYVKVMKKEPTLVLSLNPSDLHSDFFANQIQPGIVLAGTVAVREDHGFTVETGVRRVRAFLPFYGIREVQPHIGQNLFCWVNKVTQHVSGATIVLKAFKRNTTREVKVGIVNLDMLVPGCRIPFTVGLPVEGGLRGTLFDDTVSAFVNKNMLTTVTAKPTDYSLFKQLDSTLLYVIPVTKQVFVSLVPYADNAVASTEPNYCSGASVPHALVVDVGSDGVWFQFGEDRGIMPRSTIMQGLSSDCNYEDTVRLGKYQVGSMHIVCVVRYDLFDRSYILCEKLEFASEEICHAEDVLVGRAYNCEIKGVDEGGNVKVQLGRLTGIVSNYFLDRKTIPKAGSTVPMIAVRYEEDLVYLTNRAEFARSDADILSDWKQLKDKRDGHQLFDGVVVEDQNQFFVVEFFNNIRGKILKYTANMIEDKAKLSMLQCGIVTKFAVAQCDQQREILILRLPKKSFLWKGERTATVTGIGTTEVNITLDDNLEESIIPANWFSIVREHNALHVALLKVNQKLQVVQPFPGKCTPRDVRYFQYKPYSVRQVQNGDILRATIYNRKGKKYAKLLLTDYTDYSRLEGDDTDMPDGTVVMVKVTKIEQDEDKHMRLKVSSSLSDVCPLGVENVYAYMMDYLEDVINLIGRYRQNGMTFAEFNIGQEVNCRIVALTTGNGEEMAVKVSDISNPNLVADGIARKIKHQSMKKLPVSYSVGNRLNGRVTWVDVERQLVHVCVDPAVFNTIGEDKWTFPETLTTDQLTDCSVLFQNNYIRVCCVHEGSNKYPLMLVPVRHHYNELSTCATSDTLSVVVIRMCGPLLFGMSAMEFDLYSSFDQSHSKARQNSVGAAPKRGSTEKDASKSTKNKVKLGKRTVSPSLAKANDKNVKKRWKRTKKTKQQKTSPPFVIDQLDGCDNDFLIEQLDGATTNDGATKRKAPKRTEKNQKSKKIKKSQKSQKSKERKESKSLPGAGGFWDSTPVYERPQADSSDEDGDSEEDGRQQGATLKKRVSAKERFEAMKQEEERLRKIEEELANPSTVPHTPDQFERLVLAQPNNSLLWIRYMVFHMEAAEMDKARAVARKALKAINFREETELLNVWVALLNLEIRYHTVDSFREVLQEAIQYNDPFKVYSRVLEILIDCQKHTEVRELLQLLEKKFRKQNDMWYLVAGAWYRIGQAGKTKPLLSQALKALPNRDHIPLIVKFAFLHNSNGNRDEAHLLFERILTSYPKRTDIWSQYVDMLVKDRLIDNARQILERAVMQRLPMKNMKTLFTKYVSFEEKHGNRDTVRRVKEMATEYVQAQLNNAGIADTHSIGRSK